MARAEDIICRQPGANPDDWFSKPGTARTERAKALCKTCPVMEKCAKVGLEDGIPFGVWGGLDYEDRKRIWAETGGKPVDFSQILDDAVGAHRVARREAEELAS